MTDKTDNRFYREAGEQSALSESSGAHFMFGCGDYDPEPTMANQKRIHLATETGGRSDCRYSSRPSRRVAFVPLEDFLKLPAHMRCKECERSASLRKSESTK
jgi:hypothetical protein